MRTIMLLAVSISMAGAAALRAAEPTRNLALNRAAYASSCGEYYKFNTTGFIDTGHMATDGHLETMWRSKGGGPQWIYVDLGAECMVQKVVLRWDRFHAKAYKLQVSTDAGPSARTGFVENWTDVHQTADGRGRRRGDRAAGAGQGPVCPPVLHQAGHRQRFCAPLRLFHAPRVRGLWHGRSGAGGRAAASAAGGGRNVGPFGRMEAL